MFRITDNILIECIYVLYIVFINKLIVLKIHILVVNWLVIDHLPPSKMFIY